MCIKIIDHIHLVKSRHKSTISVLEVYCIPKLSIADLCINLNSIFTSFKDITCVWFTELLVDGV